MSAKASARGRQWPFIIVGLLMVSVVAHVVLVVRAFDDPSFAVERDYYAKAVAWDERMAQERANEALGWTAGVELERRGELTRLVIELRDVLGRDVAGADVQVQVFHKARSAEVLEATLDAKDGRYVAELPMRRAGRWEIRLRARRGDDVFTAVLEPELAPAAGGTP